MKLRLLLRVAVTTLIIAMIVRYFVEHRDALSPITRLSPSSVGLLVGITALINFVYAEKLLLLLRHLGLRSITRAAWLEIFLIARFMTLHLMQAGLVYRSARLNREYGFTYTRSLSTTSVLAWSEAVVILLGGAAVVATSTGQLAFVGLPLALWLFLAALLAATLPWAAVGIVRTLSAVGRGAHWLRERLGAFATYMLETLSSPRTLVSTMVLNAVSFVLQLIWTLVCLRALGSAAGLHEVALYVVAMQLSGLVRILPGNLGVTELAAGAVSHALTDQFGTGVLLSLTQRVVVYCFFALAALVWVPVRARGAAQPPP